MLEKFVNVRKEQPLIVLTPENLNPEEYLKITAILKEKMVIKIQFTKECTLNQSDEFLIALIQKKMHSYILSINNLEFIISNQLIPDLNLPKDIRRMNAIVFKAQNFPVSSSTIKNDQTLKKNRKTVNRKERKRTLREEENRTLKKEVNKNPKRGENRPPKREGSRTPRRDGGSGPPTRRRDGKPLQRRDGSRPPSREGNNRYPKKDGKSRYPKKE